MKQTPSPDSKPPTTQSEAFAGYQDVMRQADEIEDEDEALALIDAYVETVPEKFRNLLGASLFLTQSSAEDSK